MKSKVRLWDNGGEMIRTCRKMRGITQEKLAEKVGVNKAVLSNWESGKNMPRYDAVVWCLDALGFHLELKENEPENFAKIANTVSGMWEGKQEYYDGLNDYRLLVIDDLAAERKTEYMSEIIFNVIDSRYRANLPMIVTTNLTSEELQNPIDMSYQRTFSRLLEMCTPIKVEGEDKRAKKMRAGMQDMRKLLGL